MTYYVILAYKQVKNHVNSLYFQFKKLKVLDLSCNFIDQIQNLENNRVSYSLPILYWWNYPSSLISLSISLLVNTS